MWFEKFLSDYQTNNFSKHTIAMFNICSNETLLNELKCVRCWKILSVLPVYCSSDTGNICGRCVNTEDPLIKNGEAQRATAYEAIAKFLLFPCSNQENGCVEKLNFDEVVQHEKNCHFVLLPCPFNLEYGSISSKCNWRGTEANIAEHLQSNHQDFMQLVSPSFVLDTSVESVIIFFTVIDCVTFLGITHYIDTTKTFNSIVICCEKSPNHHQYCCQIELGSNNNDHFLTLLKPEIKPFGNVQKILAKAENWISADVAALQALFQGSISYKFCIMNKSNATSSAINESSELKMEQLKEKSNIVLHTLKCSECDNQMKPPIFMCFSGHSFCDSCRIKIRVCPSCLVPIKDARNFDLDDLAITLKYPCKYTDFGCQSLLVYEEIQSHELKCWRSCKRCPFNILNSCNTNEDIVDIIGHLRHEHSASMIENDHIYSQDFADGTDVDTIYWTVFQDDIFIMYCEHGTVDNPFKFNVLHPSMKKSQPKYKYHLKLYDQTGQGLKLSINNLCQIIPSHMNDMFVMGVCIGQHLMNPFVDEKSEPNRFFFKLQIKNL
ncbi:hypothetical protein FQR65_LT12129 [Abscondita terminalis]|nr:hypothetical protein FQR65_LT12129 [Abscondita terminalis]